MSSARISVGDMKGKVCFLCPGLLVVAIAASAGEAMPQSKAQQHAAAGLAASAQFSGLASLCDLSLRLVVAGQGGEAARAARAARGTRPDGATRPDRATRPAQSQAPPMQVFDNLYFVGTGAVSAWVIRTSKGLILLDTLNTDDEAKTYIDGGLRKLGLDPAQIKYLVITHAHGDHYGGHHYISEQFRPRVVMSDADWKELEKPAVEGGSPRWGPPPKRDMTVRDGEKLVLGDTTLTMYITPGHTPGTLSPIFAVKDKGAIHHAVLWGGTGFNFGPDEARLRQYAESSQRLASLAAAQGVDVFLSNHPTRDGATATMARLAERKAGEPNAFVMGKGALAAFTVLGQCALAQAERVAATPK